MADGEEGGHIVVAAGTTLRLSLAIPFSLERQGMKNASECGWGYWAKNNPLSAGFERTTFVLVISQCN
jgi:hypothetical protein